MKKLIITEKPSVAMEFIKTLETSYHREEGYFEGDTYIVTWCVGHLLTLSYPEAYGEEYAKWSLQTLPFIPEQYRYEVIPSVKGQFKAVKKCLNRKDIDTIYYAGDAAREGEYIQRLVRKAAGRNEKAEEKRVWIDSQTEDEIKRGIREAKPITYYDTMADSGYMRAIEDYLVGINFSRGLSIRYGNAFNNLSKSERYSPISVGRVMTCVLGMVVNRERDIRNAVTIPFYGIQAMDQEGIVFKWKSEKKSSAFESDKLFKEDCFYNRIDADALLKRVNGEKLRICSVIKEKESKAAPMLYNLAELQNDCSKLFKITPDETLTIIQSLYDKKMTTYPRTDARVLSSAIASQIEKNLKGLQRLNELSDSVEYVLDNGSYHTILDTKYTNDAMITDHYAIIPTGSGINQFENLSCLEKGIFRLISKRFLSIFYPAAEYLKIQVIGEANKEHFHTYSKKLIEPGYLSLYERREEEIKDNDVMQRLSAFIEGEELECNYTVTQGETSAPRRFTSGSIILAMENAGNLIEDAELRSLIKNSGIGTSATRAETIKKLIKNEYILLDKKTQLLRPSMSGEILYEIVKATLPSLLNPAMTASWEKGLSAIVAGQVSKEEYLSKMNTYITKEIENIKNSDLVDQINDCAQKLKTVYKDIGSIHSASEKSAFSCPVCGSMISKYTWGFGCRGYQEGCKVSVRKEQFGKTLTDEQIKKLILKRKLKNIVFYSERKKKDYRANLVFDYETGKVSMKFDI